jgi:cobalt-zinc-cadmium efflux system protein|uniref:Cation transporter n=1 Tax=Desulfobacca acetoxidans TaxID=60893 RepID=A0A7C3SIB4_9BACT
MIEAQVHPHPRVQLLVSSRWRLALAFATQAVFFLVELVGGILTNSLALLADAGHMLSDLGALGLSLLALFFTLKAPTPQKTYGYHRLEILVALFNGLVLWAMAAYIFYEGYHRLFHPPEIKSVPVLIIAGLGLVVNLVGAFILYPVRGHGLNLRSAFLHLVADSLGSLAVIVSGLAIFFCSWYWFDPLAGGVIALMIILGSWALVFEAVDILMESTPREIQLDEVEAALRAYDGVSQIYDLHIWTIASGVYSLSAHVAVEDGWDRDRLTMELENMLLHRFGIEHVTLQLEGPRYQSPRGCPLYPEARGVC